MVDVKSTFGFELLQTIHDSQLLKKEDVLILFVHWYFIKHGFRCIGLGDSKTFDASEKGSELLPEGWNRYPYYALRYVNDNKLYILHGTKSDEDLLLNLLRVDNQNTSNAQFPIHHTINNIHGTLKSLMPLYQNVLNVIRSDLVEPVLPGNATDISTQTTAPNRYYAGPTDYDRDPLRVGPSTRPSHGMPIRNPETDFTSVGAADLNPFGRGGGMIYDPFTPAARNPLDPLRPGLGVPGRLPPAAVPPYARFDPFGPPDIIRPRFNPNPDNDHVLPMGYDDMFM